ncbi:MAG: hypothetical protein QF785_10425 [Phycisphaeraceae bacterium]|jgi:hypothetical protein|nr:hypothetical protein [Phycisphaeraceae bacterium]MDP7348387.1 hypothetical protein [Phycisphaeraceae bacterium]
MITDDRRYEREPSAVMTGRSIDIFGRSTNSVWLAMGMPVEARWLCRGYKVVSRVEFQQQDQDR